VEFIGDFGFYNSLGSKIKNIDEDISYFHCDGIKEFKTKNYIYTLILLLKP
jgi:hypothetical protein